MAELVVLLGMGKSGKTTHKTLNFDSYKPYGSFEAFDRLEVLKESIQSYYDNIEIPFEIIIHDNGTTY